jgi:hypothetical protein
MLRRTLAAVFVFVVSCVLLGALAEARRSTLPDKSKPQAETEKPSRRARKYLPVREFGGGY